MLNTSSPDLSEEPLSLSLPTFTQIWIYEEGDDGIGEPNVYVHHDIMLPAFPLCLAWLDCDPRGGSERANLCAVGTMDPGIEIWDLDVLDAVEPVACLGGFSKAGAESEKKKKSLKKVGSGSVRRSVALCRPSRYRWGAFTPVVGGLQVTSVE